MYPQRKEALMAEVNLYQWKDLSKEEQINTNQTDEVYEAPPLYQENQEEKEQEKETEKKIRWISVCHDSCRRSSFLFPTRRIICDGAFTCSGRNGAGCKGLPTARPDGI